MGLCECRTSSITARGRSPSPRRLRQAVSGWQGQPRAFRVSGDHIELPPGSRSSHCLRASRIAERPAASRAG